MHISPFETLADPVRRRIIDALRYGERPVSVIVDFAEVHQSGVSRHLRILREAGFVKMRPKGPVRLYSLRPEPFQEVAAWLADYRGLWPQPLDRFALTLEQHRRRTQHA